MTPTTLKFFARHNSDQYREDITIECGHAILFEQQRLWIAYNNTCELIPVAIIDLNTYSIFTRL